MSKVMIGSARIDERGKATGGTAGDQKQAAVPDKSGEVSQQEFYIHSKGWNVIRPRDAVLAEKIGERMIAACNNKNLGYDQNQRLGVISKGINSKTATECDCSSLVRACVKEASGKDPGNFTTANAVTYLGSTRLFEKKKTYTNGVALYKGDILCTKTKGHIVVVTKSDIGRDDPVKETTSFYQKYTGKSSSIVDALKAVGEKDTSYSHREKIAKANGISGYKGAIAQNLEMLSLLKKGKLKKA